MSKNFGTTVCKSNRLQTKKEHLKNLKRAEEIIVFVSKIILKIIMTNFSKYFRDLLDVSFGQDTHSESVLKGLVNHFNKTNLDFSITNNRIIHYVQQKMYAFLAKIKIALGRSYPSSIDVLASIGPILAKDSI